MSAKWGWLVIATLAVASDAAWAESNGAPVVVNLAGEPAARAAIGDRVTGLRQELVEVGAARALAPELAEVVEGETPAPAFRVDLAPVRQAYAGFTYDRAQALLDAATRVVLSQAPEHELGPQLGEILYWRGKIAVAAGDQSAARRWLAAAIAVDPARRSDPAVDPPAVQQAFARARGRRSPPPGTIVIAATTPGTMARVDGAAASPAPIEIQASAGLHLVVLSAPARLRHAELIDVVARERFELAVELPVEPQSDQVARAVAVISAIAPGATRLSALGRLGGLLGADRLVVVEPGDDGDPVARLYDLGAGTLSAPVALAGGQVVAEQLGLVRISPVDLSAPPPAPDPRADLVAGPAPGRRSLPWYRRWWLWSAVGAVAATTTVLILTRDRSPELVCCGVP